MNNLPPQSAVFVGRNVHQVEQVFTAGLGVIGQAVHGLGGIGKTELALHYAHSRADRYPLRWWITADTPDNITRDLADLTACVSPGAAMTLADAQAWAINYLQTHDGWLLVLDNVDQIDHISQFLGELADHGDILITTRRDFGPALWKRHDLIPLRLSTLDRRASLQLLAELTGDLNRPEPADRLAETLGDLPLALEQAAPYVAWRAQRRSARQSARSSSGQQL